MHNRASGVACPMNQQTGFILTRNWRDSDQGVELEFWLSTPSGPQRLLVPAQQVVFFLPSADTAQATELLAGKYAHSVRELDLLDFQQQPVSAHYFSSQRQLRQARDELQAAGLQPLEGDINPAERFLMERFVSGSLAWEGEGNRLRVHAADYRPQLKVLSIDIETAMQGVELYSIAAYGLASGQRVEKVFMRGEGAGLLYVESYATERELLVAFCDWIASYDPDVLIGWNVVNFDFWFLQRLADKLRMRLPLGREGRQPYWRDLDDDGERKTVNIPGRVVLDGIEVLRTASYRFESFSLENVSREMLGDGM